MTTISRRRWLQALGVSWVTTPGLASAEGVATANGVPAVAQDQAAVAFHWRVHAARCDARVFCAGARLRPTARQVSVESVRRPATYGKSFRQYVLPIDGIDLASGIEMGTVGHEASRVILTGSGARGTNASLDQFLAVEQGLGADTPLTSLVVGVGNDDTGLGFNLSYARGGTPLPKVIDPSVVFDTLFGAPLSGEERRVLAQRRALGQSVLDVVKRDMARLMPRAPASERYKLEQHYTALREIEKRLSPRATTCAAPARPAPSGVSEVVGVWRRRAVLRNHHGATHRFDRAGVRV